MTVCVVCGGTQFETHGGNYFCKECDTQTQGTYEQSEFQGTYGLHISTKSTKAKKKVENVNKVGDSWTTYEAYNAIICEQVKALIKMGVSQKLKDVVLQLWAFYLQKSEVAFKGEHEHSDDWEPRINAFPRKRDVQVLCGETSISYREKTLKKIKKEQKKQNKKGNEDPEKATNNDDGDDVLADVMEINVEIQADAYALEMLGDPKENNGEQLLDHQPVNVYEKKKSSELKPSYLAKTLQRKKGKKFLKKQQPNVQYTYSEFMTLPRTVCFSYLGLLLLQEDILLCDIIRFAKEGHFPYMDATHHLPPSMKLQDGDWSVLTPKTPPHMKKIIKLTTKLAAFIGLYEVPCRSLLHIAVRFIKDLGLPDDLIPVVRNLLDRHPCPGVWVPLQRSHDNKTNIPMYEVEAMAHVLVAVKLIFGLDGKAERKLSKFACEKNKENSESNFFVWDEWLSSLKMKERFLRSRNIPYSHLHDHALDVELMRSNYSDVLQNWRHRTIVTKNERKYAQPEWRKKFKEVFTKICLKNNSFNRLVCCASSFPLQSRLCQQISLANNCHQYLFAETDSSLLFKSFSACSLSFLLKYWNHYKYSSKKRPSSRLLTSDESTENILPLVDKLDNHCNASQSLENANAKEFPSDGTSIISKEGNMETSKKRKRKKEGHSKTSKAKKRKKSSEEKDYSKRKKKSGRKEKSVNCELKNTEEEESTTKNGDVGKPGAQKKKSKKSNLKNSKRKKSKLKKAKKSGKLEKSKKKKRQNKCKRHVKKKKKVTSFQTGDECKIFSKNYWYLNLPLYKINEAFTNMPGDFNWLLHFTSEMIEIDVDVLYYEILVIERRLFKSKLKID